MNVSLELSSGIVKYIEGKVKSGLYKSRSEVIREAIRNMIQDELRMQADSAGITKERFNEDREVLAPRLLKEKYGWEV